LWHTDVSYERQPPGLTTLKIDTLPAVGGDTLWASSYRAYERLSPAIQKLLEGLEAVHSAKEQADASARFGGPVRREPVEHTHPIIRTHPVTKRKALYVNPVFTRRIVGLSHRESGMCCIECLQIFRSVQ
jgi:sulfonate dioxygenase